VALPGSVKGNIRQAFLTCHNCDWQGDLLNFCACPACGASLLVAYTWVRKSPNGTEGDVSLPKASARLRRGTVGNALRGDTSTPSATARNIRWTTPERRDHDREGAFHESPGVRRRYGGARVRSLGFDLRCYGQHGSCRGGPRLRGAPKRRENRRSGNLDLLALARLSSQTNPGATLEVLRSFKEC